MAGEEKDTWHSSTPRVSLLRERVFEPSNCGVLPDIEQYLPADYANREPILRRATNYRATLQAVVTPVREYELIVGDVPYREFAPNVEVMPPHVTPEEETRLRAEATVAFRQATGIAEITDFASLRTVFSIGPNYGHIIVDYTLPLRIGFGGMRKRIERRLSELPDAGGEEVNSQRSFLTAARDCIMGAQAYIRRYAAEAERLARADRRADRVMELLHIADVCSQIATDPPRTFHEALQLVWFTQLLLEIESGVSAFSFGRLDQYLHPHLEADLRSGRIDREKAQELVDCFWVKANEHNDRCPDSGRAITIGGVGQHGEDTVNETTYMLLDAAGALRLVQPKLNARTHAGSPTDYVRRCCEVASNNVGPHFYNDDTIIPALVSFGFSNEEAVEYGLIGCYETGISGKERPWPMSGKLNLGKCLELALNDGVCRISGTRLGPPTGKLGQFQTYVQAKRAYQRQVEHFVRLMVEKSTLDEYSDQMLRPQPFLSTLLAGCIESGVDVSAGGGLYNNAGIRCTGFSAVTDSLMALKTLVYDQGVVGTGELESALSHDFESCESLRQMLRNRVPKYGNDEDTVDAMARWVGEHFCCEVMKYTNVRGGRLKPGLFTFVSFHDAGLSCGALPNGRRAHVPFSNGVGPMQGFDVSGPTAVLRSASKLNYTLSPNASTLDLKLSPSILRGDQGIERLGQLIGGYFDSGGMELQLSLVSSEELRDAQVHPEEHANLLVRVAGYSAYFVTLSEDVREEIISRSEHSL